MADEDGWLELEVRRDLSEIESVQEAFDEYARRYNLGGSQRRTVQVVLDEVLSNILTHGLTEGDGSLATVRLAVEGTVLVITVIDDGPAFDPTLFPAADPTLPAEDRPQGKLGIHLVRCMTDRMVYRREEGKNVLRLEKRLDKPSQSSSSKPS